MLQALQNILTEHYWDLQRNLMEYMSSGSVAPITWEGYRVVHISTAMIGHTDSPKTTWGPEEDPAVVLKQQDGEMGHQWGPHELLPSL
ncbi:hypothetical protein A6R68_23890, partial [Neotoma lepida]